MRYYSYSKMKNHTLVFRAIDKESFEELRAGSKSLETRAATPKYQKVEAGDLFTFKCDGDSFTKVVTAKHHWPSLEAMFAEIPFKRISPDLDTVEAAIKRYASYPGYTEKIKEYGILGFELT